MGRDYFLENVHTEDKCSGEYCCIHNPSDHHMVAWPLNWRPEWALMERICPHGVGHPDPDHLAHVESLGIEGHEVHGCDGCCNPDQFAHQEDEKALVNSFRATIEDAEERGILQDSPNLNKVEALFREYFYTVSELKKLVEIAEEAIGE